MKLKWNIPFAKMFMQTGGIFPLKVEHVYVGDCSVIEVHSDFIVIELNDETFNKAMEADPELRALIV